MTPRLKDDRFFQLIDLAKSGDQPAVHELWIQYKHDFQCEGDPRDQLPTRKMTENQNPKHEEK